MPKHRSASPPPVDPYQWEVINRQTDAKVGDVFKILKVYADEVNSDSMADCVDSVLDGTGTIWVAWTKRRSVAAFIVTFAEGDDTELFEVYTSPSHRRKGLARKLITDMMLAGRGRAVNLTVRENNVEALPLYESLGFQKVGDYRHYYRVNMHGIRMRREATL